MSSGSKLCSQMQHWIASMFCQLRFGWFPFLTRVIEHTLERYIIGYSPYGVLNWSEIERLLSISGEDDQTVNRKYQSHWTGRLRTRVLVLTNLKSP